VLRCLFPCPGRDDSGGEQDDVDGFDREFTADAGGFAHRGQVGRDERQPGRRVVAERAPDHGDFRAARQGLLRDGSAEAVGPADDDQFRC